MISIFTMERPAMTPTAAPVGAALAALAPIAVTAALPGPFGSDRPAAVSANGTAASTPVNDLGKGFYAVDGVKPNACHEWITRDRQVDITTLRSSRHLRSPRT